jgi:snurportin-1
MHELLATNPNTISEFAWTAAQPKGQGVTVPSTAFPYPMTFVPIPYHSDTTLPSLLSTIIPTARSPRTISILPRRLPPSSVAESEMLVDAQSTVGIDEVQRIEVQVQSEGLLLYVSQATYEPGTSPLSTWVPTQFEGVAVLDLFERWVHDEFL